MPVPSPRKFWEKWTGKIERHWSLLCLHASLIGLRLRTGKKAILLVRTAGLGDVICCLPVYRALARKHPEKNIVFVTAAAYVPVVKMSPDVHFAMVWPGTGVAMRPAYRWHVSEVLKPLTMDEIQSPRPPGDSHIHLVDAFLTYLGLEPNRERYVLRLPDDLRRETGRRLGLAQASGRKILIHTGRSWPVREWSEANWQKLVDAIHARYDATVYHLCSPNRPNGELMPVFHLIGTIPVPDSLSPEMTAGLIGSVDLLIGIDSGPLHLAGAMGTPQVGIFGPTLPELRLQPGGNARGVHRELPCIGCHHRPPILHWLNGCPYDIACMTQLEPSAVFQAVEDVMVRISAT